MSNRIYALVIAALLLNLLAGCRTGVVLPSQVKCYGTDPMEHTIYIGSDATNHYFRCSHGFASGEWVVKRKDLCLNETFPPGKEKARFVRRDMSGNISLVQLEAVKEGAQE